MVDFSQMALFNAMQKKMAYLGERQTVLSQNIANANTPGYVPHDLKPVDFGDLATRAAQKVQLRATHPGHIQLQPTGGTFDTHEQKDTFETTPTGNAVVVEEQLLKMNDTAMQYQATTSLYKKMTDLMNNALGNR